MKKYLYKIKAVEVDLPLESSNIMHDQRMKESNVSEAKPIKINSKIMRSPLRGRHYNNRAHHGHDGSYAGHERDAKE